jgi:hypothetical protein
MIVQRYTPADAPAWDAFVAASKNGTFLLQRGYMDYHADRFRDHSLLVRDPEGRLRAVLPACVPLAAGCQWHPGDDRRLVSHGGLTYGGFVSGVDMKVPLMLEVFEAVAAYLTSQGFREWVYKTIPSIYHHGPAEEDRYALFLAGAALSRRDVLAVVDRRVRLPYQERRARAVNRARKAGLTCGEDDDLAGFWEVVTANLRERHGAAPVHSLAEIELLRGRFPANIRLFTCRGGDRLLAGVLIYECPTVAHTQYIASTEEGRRAAALDLLFDDLLGRHYTDRPYFDFGISNESDGRKLNRGLIDQKEGFGARAVAHDQYTLALAGWRPGRLLEAMT